MTDYEYDMNARRWYDRDPVLSKAMKILETSDDKLQIQVAINLIKVIIEHHIEDNEFTSVDDMIKAVEEGKLNKGNARWYDIDHTLRTAIQMLENCSLEMQSKVAREIASLVKEQFYEPEEEEGLDI